LEAEPPVFIDAKALAWRTAGSFVMAGWLASPEVLPAVKEVPSLPASASEMTDELLQAVWRRRRRL
jgi:hypothetical protein